MPRDAMQVRIASTIRWTLSPLSWRPLASVWTALLPSAAISLLHRPVRIGDSCNEPSSRRCASVSIAARRTSAEADGRVVARNDHRRLEVADATPLLEELLALRA